MRQGEINKLYAVQLSQGAEAAFRSLFDEYKDFIYSFALRFCRNEFIARDTVQEVFIKLWQQREALADISNITGYIQRITRNHVVDLLRKSVREERSRNMLAQTTESEYNNIEEIMVKKELEQLVREAVEHLPLQQQRVYQLSRHEGLKHEAIAQQLSISKETVKKHMMAALSNIQQYIQSSNKAIGVLAVCVAEIYL